MARDMILRVGNLIVRNKKGRCVMKRGIFVVVAVVVFTAGQAYAQWPSTGSVFNGVDASMYPPAMGGTGTV